MVDILDQYKCGVAVDAVDGNCATTNDNSLSNVSMAKNYEKAENRFG